MNAELPHQFTYCTVCRQYHYLGRIDLVLAREMSDWWLRDHDCPGPPA